MKSLCRTYNDDGRLFQLGYPQVLGYLCDVEAHLLPGGTFRGEVPNTVPLIGLKKLLSIFHHYIINPTNRGTHAFTATKHAYGSAVDLVILSCHRLAKTLRCLHSIRQSTLRCRVWLIDNSSPAEVQEALLSVKQSYPDVSMVFLQDNLKCGGGRNLALRYCSGAYVAWFDNDMILDPDCLKRLWETLNSRPEVGAVCAKVMLGNRVQLNGRRVHNNQLDYSNDNLSPDDPRTLEQFDCDMIHGGATMYRKKALFDNASWDPTYQTSCEDLDIMMQLRQAGWILTNCPDAVTHHYPSQEHTSAYGQIRRNKALIREDRQYFTNKWGVKL